MADQTENWRADQEEKLREEYKRTLADLQGLRQYLATETDRVGEGGADAVDTAADIYEREKTLAIIQTLEQKLASVERALRAAESGSYGICEICGEPIDPGRLEAMPHTTTCIKCQAKLERLRPISSSLSSLRDEEY
jgi:RNA polymerase-binding transcription factor DksA